MEAKVTALLEEFSAQSQSWYANRPQVGEFHAFFRSFFAKDKLAAAQWPDFQELGNRIHSFNSLALAKKNAFGNPNYGMVTYRESFEYLARGAGTLEERIRNFMGDNKTYASKYLGDGAVSEIVGQLFADDYVFMNSRDLDAAKLLGIKAPNRGDFPAKFVQFNESLKPLWQAYGEVVGFRQDLPKGLQIDQFLSWLYERDIAGKDPVVVLMDEVSRRIWVYAPGERGRFWDEYSKSGIAAIGWDEMGDLRRYVDREAIQKRMMELWPNDGKVPTNNSLCLWQFCHEVKVGDLIVSRRGRSQILGVGVVTSGYAFNEEREEQVHQIGVDWLHKGEWTLPEGTLFTTKTLTNITPYQQFTETVLRTAEFSGKETPATKAEDPPAPVVPESIAFSIESALDGLFVPEDEFRRWLSLWEEAKNLVLQGPPGTGKTFVAKRLAYCLIGEEAPERVRMVQFHPSYGYEDFVQGWKPGVNGFVRRNGSFFTFCEHARKDPHRKYVFIVDEINRGNLAKIFGELLMLVEADKRGEEHAIQLAYQDEGETFHVPANVHVLGMMNTADRSIAVVDYALRRRFRFVDLEPAFATQEFRDHLSEECPTDLVETILRRMDELNEGIAEDIQLGPGYRIGHSYFCKLRDRDGYEAVIRSQIRPLLREMWFDRLKEAEEAVERLLAS